VAGAQQGVQATADYAITQVNPHSRVWQNSAGQSVTEISTGMNYWNGQAWVPSNPRFVVSPDGSAFVASQIQDPTKLASDINCQGAVTVTTPDNVTLSSTPIAIGLYDTASGKSVILAALTNSTGVLVDPQNVVYNDAFVGGGFAASVVYSLPDTGSFCQDVVFTRFNPQFDPTVWGFAATSTNTLQIQIFTEFYGPAQPMTIERPLYIEQNPAVRASMASPDFIDYTLDFGDYVLGPGRAYTWPTIGSGGGVTVAKDFISDAGRTCLVESLPFNWLLPELKALPPVTSASYFKNPARAKISRLAAADLPSLHELKPGAMQKINQDKKSALATVRPHGVNVDYIATVSSTTTPVVYASDTTYFVNGNVYNSGSVTLEGAVFKYPTNSTLGSIKLEGALTLSTTNYRPAVFTAADDNTAGASLSSVYSNYTGIPTGHYGSVALWLNTSANVALQNFRFCYMNEGLEINADTSGQSVSLSHSELVDCITGIYVNGGGGVGSGGGPSLALSANNCLLSAVAYPLSAQSITLNGAACNCTIDNSSQLLSISGCAGGFNFTNSLYTAITAIGTLSSFTIGGAHNAFSNSPTFGTSYTTLTSNPYVSSGAGNYYLTSTNSLLTLGTTNIPAALFSQLAMKTTQLPLILTNVFTNYTILNPVVPRDTNGTALGFHYDSIDYLTGCTVSNNAVLIVTNGVTLGYYNGGGILLKGNSQLISQGTPWRRNYLVYYGSVQEQPSNYTASGYGGGDAMVRRNRGPITPRRGPGVHDAAMGGGSEPGPDYVAGSAPFAFNGGDTPSMYLRLTTICAPTGQTNLINTANPFTFEPWAFLNPQDPYTWGLLNTEYPYFLNDWEYWILNEQDPYLWNTWENFVLYEPYYDHLLTDWENYIQDDPYLVNNWVGYIDDIEDQFVLTKGPASSVSYLTLRDCEVYGSGANWLMNETWYVPTVSLINNVFNRVPFGIRSTAQISSVNNVFYGTTNANSFDVFFQHLYTTYAYSDINFNSEGFGGGDLVNPRNMLNANQNNVFDGVTVYLDGTVGCNAYLHGAENVDGSVSPRDIWTNITWLSGSLGNYYQATNGPLLHAGTTTATNLGLDQYTVLVSGTVEGTNIVSLGYHYATTGYLSETNASVDAPPAVDTPPTIVYPTSVQQVIVDGGAGPSVVALPLDASGSAPLHYQWSFNGTNMAGATFATLSINNVQPTNAGTYSVVVTNDFGSAHGTPYVLKVIFQPSIVTGPVSQIVCPGEQVAFEVQATGESPLSYQWSLNSTNIAGATNSSYSITNSAGAGGTYAVNVSNSYGSSNASATLTVVQPTNPIVIISQPTNLSSSAGSTATFNVVVSNNQCDLTYQWVKAGYGNLVGGADAMVTGGEGPSLSLSNVGSNNVGSYSVILTNGYYAVTSTIVTLSVTYTNTAPTISYVNPINCPSQNGGFPVSFSSVFNASNARDTDGIPVFFEIVSVTNGQLTINGLPFAGPTQSSPNCLFNPQSVLIWTPATNVPNSGVTAFAVKATDGILFSTNQVEVTIVPTPPVSLVGWGG
jgi:hypothetical protein